MTGKNAWVLPLGLLQLSNFNHALLAQTAPPTALTTAPASQPAKLAHVDVDLKRRQVRVECESLHVEAPLEFLLVTTGGNEHESVLRSAVRPSDLHLAMLMVGLVPGEPVRFSEATQKWMPPHGPPLQLTAEYAGKDGRAVSVPAYRLMRDRKTKRPMPPLTWIFAGSRVIDGKYAADVTGYVVSVVNFDLTIIDVPALASSDNGTLEWEADLDLLPAFGTKVALLIEPAGGGKVDVPATMQLPAGGESDAAGGSPMAERHEAPVGAPATAPGAPASPATAPAARADALPLVTIEDDGAVRIDGKPVPPDELAAEVRLLRAGGSSGVELAVGSSAPATLVARVRESLAAAHVTITRNDGSASGDGSAADGGTAAGGGTVGGTALTGVKADDELVASLRKRWAAAVNPHAAELQRAAQTHYEVIASLRREQQRIIDEADKVQRLIDELEKQYQDMTTPRPEPLPTEPPPTETSPAAPGTAAEAMPPAPAK